MLNSENIKELAHSNPTAGAVFLAFSQRERGRQVINLDLIYARLESQGVKLNHTDYFATFKRLEELEIGNLVYGRKGNPNRFVWFFDLKDIAKIGLGSSGIEPKTVTNKPKTVKMVESKEVVGTKNAEKPAKESTKMRYVDVRIPIKMFRMIKRLK
jgi:hypothetical protein